MLSSITLLFGLPVIGWGQSIIVIENPVNGTIGQSAYLPVQVTFPTNYELIWRFGHPTTGQLVVRDTNGTNTEYSQDYRTRAELFTNNGTLRLDSLRSSDSGDYTVAVNSLASGAAASETIQLRVFSVGPSIGLTVLQNPVIGTEGQSAYLLVEVIYPTPNYILTWRLGQTLVARDTDESVRYFGNYSGRSELSVRNGTFRLDNLKREDRGTFSVSISGGGEEIIKTVELRVYDSLSKPMVAVPPAVIKEGDIITLTCNTADKTDTVFTWHKDGYNITCSGSDTVCSDNSPELRITSAKESDEGNYSCSVENPVSNNASDPVQLKVFVAVSKPSITITPYPTKEGDDVTLNCTVTAGNYLSYSWYINNSLVNCSGRYECNNGSTQLTIRSAELGDSGSYNCTVGNLISANTSDATELIVYYGPSEMKLSIPADPCPDAWLNWFQIHNTLCVKESSLLTMSCEAESLPQSNYSWLHNDKETLSSESIFVIENFNSTNNGNYTCTANNDVTGKQIQQSRHLITYREPNGNRPDFNVSELKDNQVTVFCSWHNAIPRTWISLQAGNDWENGTEEVNKTVGEGTLLLCTGYHLFNNTSNMFSLAKPESNTSSEDTSVKPGEKLSLTATLGYNGGKHSSRQSQDVEILPATFNWTHPKGHEIVHNPGEGISITSTPQSSELVIDKVTENDGGKYTCVAINIFGETTISFVVEVNPVDKGPDVGLIVGATIGAIAGAVLIGVAIYFIVKSTNKTKVQYHEEEKRDTANGNAGSPVDVYAVVNKPKTTNKEDNNSIPLQDTSKPKESKSGDNELHYAELPVLQTQSFKFPRVDASNTIYSQIKTNN